MRAEWRVRGTGLRSEGLRRKRNWRCGSGRWSGRLRTRMGSRWSIQNVQAKTRRRQSTRFDERLLARPRADFITRTRLWLPVNDRSRWRGWRRPQWGHRTQDQRRRGGWWGWRRRTGIAKQLRKVSRGECFLRGGLDRCSFYSLGWSGSRSGESGAGCRGWRRLRCRDACWCVTLRDTLRRTGRRFAAAGRAKVQRKIFRFIHAAAGVRT